MSVNHLQNNSAKVCLLFPSADDAFGFTTAFLDQCQHSCELNSLVRAQNAYKEMSKHEITQLLKTKILATQNLVKGMLADTDKMTRIYKTKGSLTADDASIKKRFISRGFFILYLPFKVFI